jgi:hypothetical protein
VRPNERVSVDWGIINKKAITGENNVFALYLDLNTGIIFAYPAQSRGLAGPSLLAYIQRYGPPETIISDNAKEFIGGEFAEICKRQGITQQRSAPYTSNPNQNPVEHYMEVISSRTRSLLSISGLDPSTYWEIALEQAVNLQIRMTLPGRCTPFELTYGKQPNIINIRIFGCEALAYREKDKRAKFQSKVDQCIYIGISPSHSDDTCKILNRRQVFFNERSFPARKQQTTLEPAKINEDTAEDIIGLHFEDEGEKFRITGTSRNKAGELVVDYKNSKGKDLFSTVQEVRQWIIKQTKLTQAAASIALKRNGHINNLAEEMFKQIQTYDTKLPKGTISKPTSYHKAGNATETQWFQAEAKERDGILEFTTWTRLPQNSETRKLRTAALRAHHLYDIKRNMGGKNRVVVNGSKQTADTYTDTTSPVASQMQLRIFLFFTAARKYHMVQLDLTNAYLHAPIKDKVYIIIPEGFPGQGEVARLDKAAYGTKQGARRF